MFILYNRISNLSDTEFDFNTIKKNGLSEDSLLSIEDPKTHLQYKNDNTNLKPLGDITIKLEDIIPCMYLYVVFNSM